jgi:L-ascorbate metabolism protein UlaG (beta-lactamase superfamily)
MRLTHIGGPTVLIEFDGWRLLTDPTFDAPGRTYKFGWGTHSKKLSGPAMTPADLPDIDAILLSHDHHGDNLDDAGRGLLARAGTVVTTPGGADRLGHSTRGLRPWSSLDLTSPGRSPIRVTATPCRHGPPLSRPVAGEVIGFCLEWEGQETGALWVSGDSVMYRGLRQVAQRLDIGTAIVHLGGVRFRVTGPVRYSMTAREAIDLARVMKPKTLIPVHYEGWSHFREGRVAIDRAVGQADAQAQRLFRYLPMGSPTHVTA